MNAATILDTADAVESRTVGDALAGAALDGHGPLAGQVYFLLRRMATELRFLPNQLLSEKEVALSLAVSKTPVREAFIRLAEDGVVGIVPHSGTYVAPIDIEVAREGCRILAALFAACAEKAAERCSLGDIGRLRGLYDAVEDAPGKGGTLSEAADALFDCVFVVAGIPDARELIDATQFEMQRIGFVFRDSLRPAPEFASGRLAALVNAVVGRDGEGARRCVVEYFEPMEMGIAGLATDREKADFIRRLNCRRPNPRLRAAKK